MSYRIIEVIDDKKTFENMINAAIGEGWLLQGGVSVAAYYSPEAGDYGGEAFYIYAQAMTRVMPNA